MRAGSLRTRIVLFDNPLEPLVAANYLRPSTHSTLYSYSSDLNYSRDMGDLSEIKNDATDMSVPPHSLEMRHLFVNVNVAALNTNWKHHAHSKIKTSS